MLNNILLEGVDYTQILNEIIQNNYKEKGTISDLDLVLISNVIQYINPVLEKRKELYDRYLGKNLKIEKKSCDNKNKENNKLVNNFRPVIVNQKVGYMFGINIEKTLEDKIGNEKIAEFLKETDEEDTDTTLGKYSSVCGVAFGLLYLKNKEENNKIIPDMLVLKPWETYVILNKDIPVIGIRFVDKYNWETKNIDKCVEIYYKNLCATYKRNNKLNIEFVEEVTTGFGTQPIIAFLNNDDEKSDFEDVESLNDAYDAVLSGRQDDIMEISAALITISGDKVEIDEEEVKKAKKSGIISLPEGADAKYLVKVLDNESVENQLKILRENIFKFTHSLDINDPTFTAPESGTAKQMRFQDLETKSKTMETKFITGYKYMFKVLSTFYAQIGIFIDYNNVRITFSRSFKELPADMTELINILTNLYNNKLISKKTLLENIPFIDANLEIERLEEENNENNNDFNNDKNNENLDIDNEENNDNNNELNNENLLNKIKNIFKSNGTK